MVLSGPAEEPFIESTVPGADPREVPPRWEDFLSAYADLIFRVVRLFADGYDDRMELFLFICERLREQDMKRVRSFRRRPDAPCLFSTYLSVVIRNLSVDFLRSRQGRYRPFASVTGLETADRLLFEYHVRDGRPLEEARNLLMTRHGIQMSESEASDRAGRVGAALSPSQRWRLVSRLIERRLPMTIDPVFDVASSHSDRHGESRPVPLAGTDDPEEPIRTRQAEGALREILRDLPPRQRLALTLRYRDGLPATEVARLMDITRAEADGLARQGVDAIRSRLRHLAVGRPDLEAAGLGSIWRTAQEPADREKWEARRGA